MPFVYLEGIPLEDGVLLLSADPFVYTDIISTGGPITLDAEIILAGKRYLEILQLACTQEYQDKKKLAAQMEAYRNLTVQKDLYALELEKERDYYKGLFSVRCYLFYKRVVRGVKRRIKAVIKKIYRRIFRK